MARSSSTRSPSVARRAFLSVALFFGFYLLAFALIVGCGFASYFMATLGSIGAFKLAVPLAIVTLTIAWSIVPRIDRFVAPGPRLEKSSQPRLFAELEHIAAESGQPMPEFVYLCPDVNAWVSRRGGLMGFFSRPMMGIGLPLLASLSVDELRAVLAHEFGHFVGGETRLGPWVYKTRQAIGRTIDNLGAHRFATLPFRAYGSFFLRVTLAVSRSQEFAADQLAARMVGADAAARALRRVRTAAIAFDSFVENELNPVFVTGHRAPIAQGFSGFLAAPRVVESLAPFTEKAIAEEVAAPFATHPPMRDRIAAILANASPSTRPSDDRLALELLDDVDALELAILGRRKGAERADRMRFVPWDRVARDAFLPHWSEFAKKYETKLRDLTPLSLIEAARATTATADRLGTTALGAQTKEQRAEIVLAFALAVVLHRNGWTVINRWGSRVEFQKGDETLCPFEVLPLIRDGKLGAEEWSALCKRHAIDDVSLGEAVAAGVE